MRIATQYCNRVDAPFNMAALTILTKDYSFYPMFRVGHCTLNCLKNIPNIKKQSKLFRMAWQ